VDFTEFCAAMAKRGEEEGVMDKVLPRLKRSGEEERRGEERRGEERRGEER
jgi:hypothetical protein